MVQRHESRQRPLNTLHLSWESTEVKVTTAFTQRLFLQTAVLMAMHGFNCGAGPGAGGGKDAGEDAGMEVVGHKDEEDEDGGEVEYGPSTTLEAGGQSPGRFSSLPSEGASSILDSAKSSEEGMEPVTPASPGDAGGAGPGSECKRMVKAKFRLAGLSAALWDDRVGTCMEVIEVSLQVRG